MAVTKASKGHEKDASGGGLEPVDRKENQLDLPPELSWCHRDMVQLPKVPENEKQPI